MADPTSVQPGPFRRMPSDRPSRIDCTQRIVVLAGRFLALTECGPRRS